jgi:nitrogen fixation protein NifQ
MQTCGNVVMQNSLPDREMLYQELRNRGDGSELADLVARMLASQVSGMGDMPERLGLSRVQFANLLQQLYGLDDSSNFDHYGNELDLTRSPEHEDLRNLFLEHTGQNVAPQTAEWVADILVAGCMGGDHLWQDMGFWSRDDLSGIIRYAFAPLADKNTQDMKWKKFFYKQLCVREGVYACRAPSCQVCVDYANCFGPE